MANMVIPNEGKLLLSEWMLETESASFGATNIGLYSNNYTPVDGSILSNFTAATFTGYTAFAISRSTWNAATIVADVAVKTLPTEPNFTCTGGSPQDVYGWYWWDPTAGKVLAAQRFAAARTMNSGATELLDPFAIKLKTFT